MTELFANYEINRAPRWPRLARLIAGSFALHVLLVACVLYVPGVRDALNIAGAFSGVGYTDEDYRKTAIGDQVVMVDTRDKFRYPPGYFATTNAPTAPAVPPETPQIISLARPPVVPPVIKPTPKPTPAPTPQPTPVASPQASPSVDPTDPAKTTEVAADKEMSREEAEKKLDEIAAQSNVVRPSEDKINKRPLKDWLAEANELKVKGELDLSGTIEMTIEADLGPDGKLRDAKVIQRVGDPKLAEVAKTFVAALSDSNALYFLKDPKFPDEVKRLRLTVKLNETEVVASVESEAHSAERAEELKAGYNGLLFAGKIAKRGQDEEVIYKNTKISANGKQIVVNFTMPRKTADDMLSKQIPTETKG